MASKPRGMTKPAFRNQAWSCLSRGGLYQHHGEPLDDYRFADNELIATVARACLLPG
jgi:hypothetical protein